MAAKTEAAICPACGRWFRARRSYTLTGLRRYVCRDCRHRFLYPLGMGLRIAYIGFMAAGLGFMWVADRLATQWLLAALTFAVLLALVQDWHVRRQTRNERGQLRSGVPPQDEAGAASSLDPASKTVDWGEYRRPQPAR